MLKVVSDTRRFLVTVGVILLNMLLGILTVAAPAGLGFLVVIKSAGHPMIGAAGIGLMMFGAAMNLIDLVACSVFLMVMMVVLLHRLIWPLV